MTALDAAHAAMADAPDDDVARLRFFALLADTPLLVLLEAEAAGDGLKPRLFPLETGTVVVAFDGDDRLSAFAGGPAPFAEVPGRVLAALLAGQGMGLGLNLGVAPSSVLIPAEGLGWLTQTLAQAPERASAWPQAFHAPAGLPEGLIAALDGKLARAAGLARSALLSAVTWTDGRRGHLLAFVDAVPEAEMALARAVGEALTFSGIEAGEMDVVFLSAGDPSLLPQMPVALRFDLAEAPQSQAAPAPEAPGTDPARPPKLR